MIDFETTIGYDGEDIVVGVEVTDYYRQPARPNTWDSDWDAAGYTDFECRVWYGDMEIFVDDDTFRRIQKEWVFLQKGLFWVTILE